MKLMRRLLLLVWVVSIVSTNVLASDERDCFQGQAPQSRIRGCSEIIRRAPNDATAYHNRAVAYGLAGDTDRAIADYSRVIEIAPNNASAYDNRARAYASKGDYIHAAADETKASELIARANAQPTAISSNTPTIAQKTKTRLPKDANNKVGKEASSGSWWSWFKN